MACLLGEVKKLVPPMKIRLPAVMLVITAISFGARAQTNSWIDGNGKWELAPNWSRALAPSGTDQADIITNGPNNTVTIDATTSGGFPGTMTISNLLVNANQLSLVNAGTNVPLHILNLLMLTNSATMIVTNSAFETDGVSVGNAPSAEISDSSLKVQAGGSVQVNGFGAEFAIYPSDRATLTIEGGIMNLQSALSIGYRGTGTLWVANGSLVSDNLFIGLAGIGSATISNGSVVVGFQLALGNNAGSQGRLTILGGNVTDYNFMDIGNLIGAQPATVLLQGGALYVTNATGTAQLRLNDGTLVLSNGATLVADTYTNLSATFTNLGGTFILKGRAAVDQGTATFSGGTNQFGATFTVGSSVGSTGTVVLTGGTIVVTNGVFGIGTGGSITDSGGAGQVNVSALLLSANIVVGNSSGTRCDLFLTDTGTISDVGCPNGNCSMVINSLGFQQTNGTASLCATPVQIGVTAAADFEVSGDAANDNFQDLYVGYENVGTFTMAGGAVNVCAEFDVGHYGLDDNTVIGTGAVWVTGGQLTMDSDDSIVGNSGVGQMSISNGVVTAAIVTVGKSANPSSFGTLTLAGGTLTVSGLVLPNPRSQFVFVGGCLNTPGITNSNGQMLTLGNGTSPITLNLMGGISSFGNGLKISTNAMLSGFGTITGTVVNFGLISPSNTVLTFTGGDLTNNGTMRVVNSVIEAYGTVVNNGTIDIINGGGTNFHGTFINHGTVWDAHSIRVSNAVISNNNVTIQIPSLTGHTYQLQAGGSLTTTNWANNGASQAGTGGVLTFIDLDGATNSPPRFYRVDVSAQ
jgi:hypothetical protein